MKVVWPKQITTWKKGEALFMSIPFTWELPKAREIILHHKGKRIVVGGAATKLMPNYFHDLPVEVHDYYPGALQKINPNATKTTEGCPNSCCFCAVPDIEGPFRELKDWPDKPVICDNNLLAASESHFDRVIDRLIKHEHADFNQGLDIRLLTGYHAKRIREIRYPMVRLALDHMSFADHFERALELLFTAKIPKSWIRVYAIVGHNTDPGECWNRCQYIERFKVKVLPMWHHPLDVMKKNTVTANQKTFGWNDFERRRIMGWFYQHRVVTR